MSRGTAAAGTTPFAAIEDAIEDIRAGKFVVVVDAADRENEGDLTIAANGGDSTEIALVPHTLAATTRGSVSPGHAVNLKDNVLSEAFSSRLAERSPP